MENSAIANSPSNFVDQPTIEQAADSLSVDGPNNTVIRLPAYSKRALSLNLAKSGPFEVKARSLFPNHDRQPGTARSLPRFAVKIIKGGQPCTSAGIPLGRHLWPWPWPSPALDQHPAASRKMEIRLLLAALIPLGFPSPSDGSLNLLLAGLVISHFFVGFPFSFYFAPPHSKSRQMTAAIGGFTWERNDFCRGWLITGDTGAGKTFAINVLLHSVFQHEPDWGGLCCDEKGIYHETLVRMARKYGRESDLLLLQTRPDHAEDDWLPPARFNLLSDPTIPWSTYATVIVDTASALASGSEDKGFFKTQAHANIGRGIQLFRLLDLVPTMHHLLEVLQYQPVLKSLLQRLESLKIRGNADARECYDHFQNGYLRQPPEQLGGVISTIYNYLNYFTNPDIVEVFGPEEYSSTFRH